MNFFEGKKSSHLFSIREERRTLWKTTRLGSAKEEIKKKKLIIIKRVGATFLMWVTGGGVPGEGEVGGTWQFREGGRGASTISGYPGFGGKDRLRGSTKGKKDAAL